MDWTQQFIQQKQQITVFTPSLTWAKMILHSTSVWPIYPYRTRITTLVVQLFLKYAWLVSYQNCFCFIIGVSCTVAPDSVRGAKIDIVSDTNVFALWSSPWKTNGILRGYRVTCTVLEDYNKPQYVKYDSNLTTTSMNITSLGKDKVEIQEYSKHLFPYSCWYPLRTLHKCTQQCRQRTWMVQCVLHRYTAWVPKIFTETSLFMHMCSQHPLKHLRE